LNNGERIRIRYVYIVPWDNERNHNLTGGIVIRATSFNGDKAMNHLKPLKSILKGKIFKIPE